MTKTTARQQAWLTAAEGSDDLAATLFRLVALPNATEREHSCSGHAVGFRRDGRRGFKCGVCRTVLKWVDEAPAEPTAAAVRRSLSEPTVWG